MKKILPAFFLGAALCLPAAAAQDIKPPAWAGQFYEADPARLAAEIEGFLRDAGAAPPAAGRPAALIAPHAGYVYSGPTAALAYAAVRGGKYKTVVIIGPSHRHAFRGCSIWPKGGFRTPLGVAEVDSGLAAALGRASGFGFVPEAFAEEHSVEVQIPFVQTVLPGARIVAIVMGDQDAPTVRALAAALAETLPGREALVVASTDLSHFLAREEARERDAATIGLVRDYKTDALLRRVARGENAMCGGGPVVAALLYAKALGATRVEVLGQADSTDGGAPADRVVGYFAAAVYAGEGEPGAPEEIGAGDRRALLALAREAVTRFVKAGDVVQAPDSPAFAVPRGVFVTLRKRGELRGCIGYVDPILPLGRAVVETAVLAASEDPRFPAVRADELAGLAFEISVLTPPRDAADPRDVKVGRHGLIISRDGRRGLLLPQVATENGWDRETFLDETCLKAGLPRDAWKHGAKIQLFEAIVFAE